MLGSLARWHWMVPEVVDTTPAISWACWMEIRWMAAARYFANQPNIHWPSNVVENPSEFEFPEFQE